MPTSCDAGQTRRPSLDCSRGNGNAGCPRGEVREFGLTGLTRNQVSLTAPGVRIPPSPPTSPSLARYRPESSEMRAGAAIVARLMAAENAPSALPDQFRRNPLRCEASRVYSLRPFVLGRVMAERLSRWRDKTFPAGVRRGSAMTTRSPSACSHTRVVRVPAITLLEFAQKGLPD
jgi:hypothetical protein